MFNINDVVIKKDNGLYIIDDIQEKDFGLGKQTYLILKPYYKQDKGLVYLPLNKAQESLRPVIDKERAMEVIKNIPSIESVWISDPKARKQKYEELFKSGEITNYCILVKSLYNRNEILKQNKRTLSIIDKEFLDKIENAIDEELAFVLEIPINEIKEFILKNIEA